MNLASRLEENARAGQVLVSESTAGSLTDRYEFGPPEILDLKGKGPTPCRALLRRSTAPITVPLTSEVE